MSKTIVMSTKVSNYQIRREGDTLEVHFTLLTPNDVSAHPEVGDRIEFDFTDKDGKQVPTFTGDHVVEEILLGTNTFRVFMVLSTVNCGNWNPHDFAYLTGVSRVLAEGKDQANRTDTSAIKVFGHQMVFDLREGFPLLTSKAVNFTPIKKELLWMCRGETNINQLGCGIWDSWADETGECGPIYGAQWRRRRDVRTIGLQPSNNSRLQDLINNGYHVGSYLDSSCGDPTPHSWEHYKAKLAKYPVENVIFALKELDVEYIYVDVGEEVPKGLSNTFFVEFESIVPEGNTFIGLDMENSEALLNVQIMLDPYAVYDNNIINIAVKEIDQIADAIHDLRTDPSSRRIIVDAWNPAVLPNTRRELTLRERYETEIEERMKPLLGNEKWSDEACRRHGLGDVDLIMQARNVVESDMHNEASHDDATCDDAMSHSYLDQCGTPTSVKVDPKENAALGRQSLAACHTLFQLNTQELTVDERLAMYFEREFAKTDISETPMTNVELIAGLNASKCITVNVIQDSVTIEVTDEPMAHALLDVQGIPRHFLDILVFQRSGDTLLGVPFNIASYGLLVSIIGKIVNMVPRNLIQDLGNMHIYSNHIEQMETQMLQCLSKAPKLVIDDIDANDPAEYDLEDIHLIDYIPGIKLKGDVAV